ncbi:hypothetical protein A0256_01805 [Mucilaginibacter sp. PAMC 26640]|nr:hypothetical protein A0256_01805 [Mucilaginibacter sp. PAMC 26640]
MASNYDNSAFFYDELSRLVFGEALVKAQTYFLPHIPPNCSLLVIGGGTGWILEEIAKVHSSGLKISYVEISSKMMALSRRRNAGGNKISFINQAVEDVKFDTQFDVVITPFLFDNYPDDKLEGLILHIHRMLKPEGIWLNTDFQLTGKWWQFALMKTMVLFFKILCGVESWRLPNVDTHFQKLGYQPTSNKSFFYDFIVTRVYRK